MISLINTELMVKSCIVYAMWYGNKLVEYLDFFGLLQISKNSKLLVWEAENIRLLRAIMNRNIQTGSSSQASLFFFPPLILMCIKHYLGDLISEILKRNRSIEQNLMEAFLHR